jgi:cytochrome c-type biogenesis protein CcmH/NrfG
MTARSACLLAAFCLCAVPAAAQDSLPPQLREARASIAAGKIDDAIHMAERYTRDHSRDAVGFLVLGDAWMKQMPVGRFRAAQAYQEAERLAPRDPAPPYQHAQVGLWLGGDDGERMAAQGLERVLGLDPLYQDAWDGWLTLFRNSGSRRRMAELLRPYRANPLIRSRLALLAIEDERYDEANQLLDSALVVDSTNAAWLALRAQSAFEAGDTTGGWDLYRRALAHADRDSTDALWHQAIGIAWPYEVKLWAGGVPPAQRQAWLESFWARRNPNLFAGVNHRVAEHFARFRYARRHYALLHPLISYHRSQIGRAMNLEPSAGEREYYQRCEMYEVLSAPFIHAIAGMGGQAIVAGTPLPGVSSARDQARISVEPMSILTEEERDRVTILAHTLGQLSPVPFGLTQTIFAPLGLDLRSMDSVAARVGYNLATGLDDRGVMYLRFGAPDQQFVGGRNVGDPRCGVPDVERWKYAEYGEVRFSRPSAFSRGERTVPDMVFRAMNEGQFAAARTGLTRDDSSEPAPLEFGIWTAQFRDTADARATDLVVISTRGAVAASLEATSHAGGVYTGDAGTATVPSTPGLYVLVAQAQDSGLLGRQTLALTVRPFARTPGVSDLLLAPAWDEPGADRAAMLAHLQRTLTFAQGSTVRSYAEAYGLTTEAGTVRYRAQYELLKTERPERDIALDEWPRATRFEFRRERPAAGAGAEVETLDIVPAQVPPGKYLLRVRIQDLVTGRDVGRGSIAFAVR